MTMVSPSSDIYYVNYKDCCCSFRKQCRLSRFSGCRINNNYNRFERHGSIAYATLESRWYKGFLLPAERDIGELLVHW